MARPQLSSFRTIIRDQRGVAMALELVLLAVVMVTLGFVAYRTQVSTRNAEAASQSWTHCDTYSGETMCAKLWYVAYPAGATMYAQAHNNTSGTSVYVTAVHLNKNGTTIRTATARYVPPDLNSGSASVSCASGTMQAVIGWNWKGVHHTTYSPTC